MPERVHRLDLNNGTWIQRGIALIDADRGEVPRIAVAAYPLINEDGDPSSEDVLLRLLVRQEDGEFQLGDLHVAELEEEEVHLTAEGLHVYADPTRLHALIGAYPACTRFPYPYRLPSNPEGGNRGGSGDGGSNA